MMRAPRFWFDTGWNWRAAVLAPLSWLYGWGVKRRLAQPGTRVAARVICVGNLTAGGNGKTPTVIALVERMQAYGTKVQVVSRGYRGRLEGPHKVNAALDNADDVGDEPLLIAQFTTVWVAKNRLAGCQAAVADGAEVIVLDNGFQDPSVIKDVSVVVVDSGMGFSNGRLIPAGPLREPVDRGLARANAVLVIGEGNVPIPTPVIRAHLQPLNTGMDWQGARVLAFAGIGRPEKFFATLRDLGAVLVETVELGDHEAISPALVQRLTRQASALDAQLVTTEKDMVRIRPDLRDGLLALPVRLISESWDALDALLGQD